MMSMTTFERGWHENSLVTIRKEGRWGTAELVRGMVEFVGLLTVQILSPWDMAACGLSLLHARRMWGEGMPCSKPTVAAQWPGSAWEGPSRQISGNSTVIGSFLYGPCFPQIWEENNRVTPIYFRCRHENLAGNPAWCSSTSGCND